MLIALCGLGAGWAMGASWHYLAVIFFAVIAALGSWALGRSAHVGPVGGQCVAKRAWFASSVACMVVLVLVWVAVGWSLPGLALDGVSLDPAGALGWTAQWMLPRLRVAMWLLAAGAMGLVGGVACWVWQKSHRKPPHVLALWGVAPFFWMAALGLLVGLSTPWRQSVSHSLATQWRPAMEPSRTVALAASALSLSKMDPAAAVWAHALALRAYQDGGFDKKQLDEHLSTLAQFNSSRDRLSLFPRSLQVGIESAAWCRANLARTASAKKNWSTVQGKCSREPPGRKWDWIARH